MCRSLNVAQRHLRWHDDTKTDIFPLCVELVFLLAYIREIGGALGVIQEEPHEDQVFASQGDLKYLEAHIEEQWQRFIKVRILYSPLTSAIQCSGKTTSVAA